MGLFDTIKNLFSKKKNSYISGFAKTNDAIGKKLRFKAKNLNPDNFMEELMVTLIEADIGYKTSEKICEKFFEKYGKKVVDEDSLIEGLNDTLRLLYSEKEDKDIVINSDGPTINLIVGVNGSGKTTTIAKLANLYKSQGKKVLLIAGDTFRAGAREQLVNWAKRLDCDIVYGKDNQDPSSVIVDGLRKAKELSPDIILCDTAGRLQNKTNLMNELAKMKRVIQREIEGAPHNTWLVLDGNTGQNGLSQAILFKEITDVNGIILTKMDGTSKGGIILSIKSETGIPVRYFTSGENIEAIEEFNLDLYLYSIIGDLSNGSK